MKGKKKLIKDEDENIYMTQKNIKICVQNSQRYDTPQLNSGLQLHYYGFKNIDNLMPFININTLYLNNNVIQKIQNIYCQKLVTINLNNNRISKIQGLSELTQLKILDLSCNQIQKIQNMDNLKQLQNLNISQNKLSSTQSIFNIFQTPNLTSLSLKNNPLPPNTQIYNILRKLQKLLTLYLKDTQFNRGIRNYRKQTIFQLKTLTYLDESPITKNERLLIQAWKQGGIKQQRQKRKQLHFQTRQKQIKQYQQILKKNQKIDQLRQALYQKETQSQIKELQQLQKTKKSTDQSNIYQIKKLNLQIQQLKLYLNLYRQTVNYRTVAQIDQVPKCLDTSQQTDIIYVYGVKQQQIQKIKQAYYPQQTRPIVAKNYGIRPQQKRWIQQYQQILEDIAIAFKRDLNLVVPAFNLKIHQFDQQAKRKVKRFSSQQIQKKMKPQPNGKIQYNVPLEDPDDNLNQLD